MFLRSVNYIFLIFIFHLVVAQDLSSSEEDDCGLDAAESCFPPIHRIFQCYLNPLSPGCASYQTLSQADLEGLCNQVQESLNDCMLKLLGSCSASDPKHGYFQQWLKPLNAMLDKLCSAENLKTLVESSGCLRQNVTMCIVQFERVDWIEMITTKMSSDVCMNVESRVQQCLTNYELPPQCMSFNTILMDLTQEFIDNTGCNNQPAILVPLDDKDSPKSSATEEEVDEENERDCELSPFIISKCFQPILSSWICYFNSDSKCNFQLAALCSSANESFNSCANNLIGYGCEDVPRHNSFKAWLAEFNSLQEEICGSELSATNKKYFMGKTECWDHFFICFQSLESTRQFINLITTRITGEICRDLSDKVESCLILMDSTENICGPVFEKIQAMKNKFISSKACNPPNTTTIKASLGSASRVTRLMMQPSVFCIFNLIISLMSGDISV